MNKILILALPFLVFSCKESPKAKETPVTEPVVVEAQKGNLFTNSIEAAHKEPLFLKNEAVSFDLEVSFGGNTILDAKLTQLTDGSKIRIDKKDGTKIIFDNKEVFLTPKDAEDPMARFHIFTWSYFFSLPYKLNDEGTIWSEVANKKWGDAKELYTTSKLTFEKGTGDAPDDWYVIYKNPTTNVLEGAAYIVSFGKDVAEAEKEPHAIKYNNFINVDGVPFATNWTFHMWTDAEGYGAQIGEVKLKNIKFTKNLATLFEKTTAAKILEAPKM